MAALSGLSGLVLGRGQYRLDEVIGTGACGQVWSAQTNASAKSKGNKSGGGDGGEWVVKVVAQPPPLTAAEKKKKKRKKTDQEKFADSLYWESVVYSNHLRGHPAIPALPPMGAYGECDTSQPPIRYLVMERLGPNLLEVLEAHDGALPASVVGSYGSQMLHALRELHARNFLFVDVKPDNFMLGIKGSDNEDKIYMVDFGVADKYINARGEHKETNGTGAGCGTPAYMSLSMHAGLAPSRKDDLQALSFVLMKLLVGSLPWENSSSAQQCYEQKKTATEGGADVISTDLLAGVAGSTEVASFYERTTAIGFKEEPDYDNLHAILKQLEAVKGSDRQKVKGKASSASASSSSGSSSSTSRGSMARKGRVPAREKGTTKGSSASKRVASQTEANAKAKASKGKAGAARKAATRRKGAAKRKAEVEVSSEDDEEEEEVQVVEVEDDDEMEVVGLKRPSPRRSARLSESPQKSNIIINNNNTTSAAKGKGVKGKGVTTAGAGTRGGKRAKRGGAVGMGAAAGEENDYESFTATESVTASVTVTVDGVTVTRSASRTVTRTATAPIRM